MTPDTYGEDLAARIAKIYSDGELTKGEVRAMMNRAIEYGEVDPTTGWFELQAVGAV